MPCFKNKAVLLTAGLLFLQNTFVFAAPVELTLEQSVDIALKNNPSIQIAAEDRARSVWEVDTAKAGKKPSVSLGSRYSYQGQGQSQEQDSFSNSISMNWQLYSGGQTEAQIDQAKLGVMTADLDVLKARQQLKQETTTGYYSVLEAQNMVAVNEESVSNLQTHLAIVQAKYEAGVVAKSEVLRSEVELANAEQNLIKAQNQYELAVSSLLNTMNMDGDTEIRLAGELNYETDARTLAEAISQARENRPEIAQAKISVDSAAKGITIAESNKRPSVSLSASTGWDDTLLPNDDQNWSIGASASWNIFDAGVTKSKINQAQAALNKAKLQSEQTEDAVEQEVRQSYLSMREAEKRLQTTEVAANKAKEDLYIAQETYRAGVGTNLDVLDAQLALNQAMTNHVQALYDYNVNKASLDKAIGLQAE